MVRITFQACSPCDDDDDDEKITSREKIISSEIRAHLSFSVKLYETRMNRPPTTRQHNSIIFFPSIRSLFHSFSVSSSHKCVYKRLQMCVCMYANVAIVNRLTAQKNALYFVCRNNQSGWHFCHAVCIFIFALRTKSLHEKLTENETLNPSKIIRYPFFYTHTHTRSYAQRIGLNYVCGWLVSLGCVCADCWNRICGRPWRRRERKKYICMRHDFHPRPAKYQNLYVVIIIIMIICELKPEYSKNGNKIQRHQQN